MRKWARKWVSSYSCVKVNHIFLALSARWEVVFGNHQFPVPSWGREKPRQRKRLPANASISAADEQPERAKWINETQLCLCVAFIVYLYGINVSSSCTDMKTGKVQFTDGYTDKYIDWTLQKAYSNIKNAFILFAFKSRSLKLKLIQH